MKLDACLDLPERLTERLASGPLGLSQRKKMSPQLSYGRHYGPAGPDARQAAVLVLLYRHADRWTVPLTKRPDTMKTHAGQISLPGGMLEAGERPIPAALRELHEELGIEPDKVQVLGELPATFVWISNFHVHAIVGALAERVAFIPNPAEVAEVIEFPLADLLDPANRSAHTIQRRGLAFAAPHYRYGNHQIWGATSKILTDLAAQL